MFDAAFPPPEPYPGCQAVAGYIGGRTPHVWTLAEWQRFGRLRQLGIWVADLRPGAPSARPQGQMAVRAAIALGWRPFARHRRAIVIDMELSEDAQFTADFAGEVRKGGFACWPYGSKSAIYSDPAMDGYWVADWDLVAGLEKMPHAVAHQYRAEVPFAGTKVDLSVLSGEGYARLGRGPRRLVAA
jgi:hypothetical protein